VVTCKNVAWLRTAPLPPAGLTTAPTRVWNAALAALILSILALSLSAAWSAAVLLRTTIKREKMGGFSYGTMLANAFGLPFLLITAGVLLNALSVLVRAYEGAGSGWHKNDTAVYAATMVFAFILAAFYLVYSALLVAFRGAFVPALVSDGGGGVEMAGSPRA